MFTVGIDIGSLTTKAVIVGDGKVISHRVVLTGESSQDAVTIAVQEVISLAGLTGNDIAKFISTGVGKGETSYSNEEATEALSAVRGAQFYYPSAKTVIDMGAESVRVVRCNAKGQVLDFAVNEKCASGTGTFLDTIAKALEVKIEDLGLLSLQAKEDIVITATCAVFAESEVVGLIGRGEEKDKIIAGIIKSVAKRVYGQANRVGINNDVIFIGGGAKNIGISKAIEELMKKKLIVPQEPQIIGALGAALIAQEGLN